MFLPQSHLLIEGHEICKEVSINKLVRRRVFDAPVLRRNQQRLPGFINPGDHPYHHRRDIDVCSLCFVLYINHQYGE